MLLFVTEAGWIRKDMIVIKLRFLVIPQEIANNDRSADLT